MEIFLIIIGSSSILGLIGYGIYLIKQEIIEAKLDNLLNSKMDIDDYLNEVGNLLATASDKRSKNKYSLYKSNALFYKGEKNLALLTLNDVKNFIKTNVNTKLQVADIEKRYVVTLFRIMLEMPYTEEVDKIFEEHNTLLKSMIKEREYKFEVLLIFALQKYRKNEIEDALNEFKKIKLMNLNRINKIFVRYYLALIYADLDRLIECEKEIEEIEDLRKKNKKQLFIYKKLDEVIKEKRSNITNLSGIDKDLEESMQREALSKVNREIENEVNKEFNRLKQQMSEKIEEEKRVKEQEVKD